MANTTSTANNNSPAIAPSWDSPKALRGLRIFQTTAVAPSICMTVTCSPGSNSSPSFNGRAVHTWPSSFTWPSSRATRSSTSALLPSSASMPVGRLLRRGQTPAQGGPDQHQQQHRDDQEHRAVDPDRQVQQPAGSGRGQRAAAQHEQEHVAGERLGAGQAQRDDQPDHGRRHAVRISRDRPAHGEQLHCESCGAQVSRSRCGPMPGWPARPRPTTSSTRYPVGRQGNP